MKEKRNKRKKKGILKKFLVFILLIMLIAGGWFGYRIYKNGGGLSGILATVVGHDENTKKNLGEIKVLILGISTDLDSQLTDTIMVASYDPNTQKANLLSIPRDSFTGKNVKTATASQKINAIYNIYRTPQKTLDAVNEITGLDLQYYVVVRTEGLIQLVDAIGGVEFDVPIDMYYTDPTQNLVINLKKGLQKLDGNKAEQLLRFRHNNNGSSYPVEYGDNDLGRMRTQREFIMTTLKQTLKPSNIFKLGQILEIANENVETNLNFSYVKDYIPYAVEFDIQNMKTATLPGTTPSLTETNNVSIFVVNKKQTEELIQSMFYEEEEDIALEDNLSKIKIELINGSGDIQKFEKAKKVLESKGYIVAYTSNTSSISKTVITNKSDVSSEELNKIKDVLAVGNITSNKENSSKADISIIIGRDFK